MAVSSITKLSKMDGKTAADLRIIAETLYLKLHVAGFQMKQKLAVITHMVSMVSDSIDQYKTTSKERQNVVSVIQDEVNHRSGFPFSNPKVFDALASKAFSYGPNISRISTDRELALLDLKHIPAVTAEMPSFAQRLF